MATQWYQAVHATKRFRLLTKKTDISGNVYIYLKGVASLAAGDAVVFDEAGVTARLSTATAVAQPVAVALAANTSATNFSWFQIYGNATVNCAATVAADAYLQSSGTAGQVDDLTAAGKTIVGATSTTAGASNVLTAWLNYPFYPNAALA
jgi:hypothetical protein